MSCSGACSANCKPVRSPDGVTHHQFITTVTLFNTGREVHLHTVWPQVQIRMTLLARHVLLLQEQETGYAA